MASAFDSLPKQLQSLQLLIDQFRDAEEWEERDEVLADIINHETEEALAFLRLVADNAGEDVYARCDAVCAIARRTRGAERVAEVLAYLQDTESTYEYCRATEAAGEAPIADAIPLLWAAWERDLEEEAMHATVDALETLVADEAAERFTAQLEGQDTPDKLDFVRDDLMLKALARIRPQALKPRLIAWEAKLRALAKAHPADEGELSDIADLTHEAIATIDAPDDTAQEET